MLKLLRAALALVVLIVSAACASTQAANPSDSSVRDIAPAMTLGRGWITNVAWSPDQITLAVSSSIGVWLYNPAALKDPPHLLSAQDDIVSSAAYSPDGRLMASGSWDNTIVIWDMQNGK